MSDSDVVVGKSVNEVAGFMVFKKHRTLLSYELLAKIPVFLRRNLQEFFYPEMFFLRRDCQGDFEGFGSLPFGIRENMEPGNGQALNEIPGVFEIGSGFSAHTGNGIYSDEGMRNGGFDFLYF